MVVAKVGVLASHANAQHLFSIDGRHVFAKLI
jgi:hypothetical protein